MTFSPAFQAGQKFGNTFYDANKEVDQESAFDEIIKKATEAKTPEEARDIMGPLLGKVHEKNREQVMAFVKGRVDIMEGEKTKAANRKFFKDRNLSEDLADADPVIRSAAMKETFEEKIHKRNKADKEEVRDEERDFLKEDRFRKTVAEEHPSFTEEERLKYFQESQRFSNEKDSSKRMLDTDKFLLQRGKSVEAFKEKLDKPKYVEQIFRSEKKAIEKTSASIKDLMDKGVPAEEIEQILKDKGFSADKIETLIAPLSPKAKSEMKSIPLNKGWPLGYASEKEVQNILSNILPKLLANGASIKTIVDELNINKGFDSNLVYDELNKMAVNEEYPFTPRQLEQIHRVPLKEIF